MTAETPGSLRRTARLAGGLYLSLLPLGVFSFVYVPATLVVRGDTASTVGNIIASEWLFRVGTVSHLLSQIIVVLLALALYRLVKYVNKEHATLMVVLALLCVPISVVAEVNHLAVLRLLGSADTGAFTSTQVNALAMLLLEMRQSTVLLAQVFWGLWLVALASLVYRSTFLPKVLGVAVLIAATGYLVDSAAHVLYPNRGTISQFTAGFEVLLPLWLMIKGVNVDRLRQIACA